MSLANAQCCGGCRCCFSSSSSWNTKCKPQCRRCRHVQGVGKCLERCCTRRSVVKPESEHHVWVAADGTVAGREIQLGSGFQKRSQRRCERQLVHQHGRFATRSTVVAASELPQSDVQLSVALVVVRGPLLWCGRWIWNRSAAWKFFLGCCCWCAGVSCARA